MCASITKADIEEEQQELVEILENRNISDVTEQSNKELKLLMNTTLDIAITGVSGVGKSSLVNAMRGMPDDGEGTAETGEMETTMERKKYPHPTFPNVVLWDLPGVGTPQFEPKKYSEKMKFGEYDFFIIVASNRFSTNDVLLAREIQKMGKNFYYVRTKVDVSIDSERRKPNFNEKECLEKIRTYCYESLVKAGEYYPKVFLISRWDLQKYDFPLLLETLKNDMDGLKRDILIAAMPAFSPEDLERKKAAMDALIWKAALVSCATGAIPIPGLSLACDITILVSIMKHFCQVFCLDEDSLHRLADQVNKPYDVLRSAVRKSPLASHINKEFVIHQFKYIVRAGLTVQFAKFIPVLGSLVGAGLSLTTTFHFLKSFLNDVVEDAENVLAVVTS